MRLFTQTRAAVLTAFSALLIRTVLSVPTQTPPQKRYGRYDFGVEGHAHMKRQEGTADTSFIRTVGAPLGEGPDGSVALRIEIRDLQKDETMWTLYLLTLDWLQSIDQKSKNSWYGLMGVHGRPFTTYDGVQPAPGMEGHGYCHHVDILFPSWHRPYLVLYEQVLYFLMYFVAQMYPEGPVRDKYAASAKNFRIPYWDWAAVPESGQTVFPASVMEPSVTLQGPNGPQTVDNPLFEYIFQPLNPDDLPDAPLNIYPRTVRYPTTSDANAASQNGLVAQQIQNSAASFRSRLYNLFTNYEDYETFSNSAWIPEAVAGEVNKYDSIESLHDQIHGLVGSGGHMSWIDYSAFDPIFMLHHCSVDRAFAIWQELHPDDYVTPELSRFGSYTIEEGTREDANTPLAPFRTSGGGFLTSNSVRSTRDFRYAYPETANKTGVDVKAQAISAINKLYGPDSQGTVSGVIARDTSNGLSYREWIANIRVLKHALNGPFFIHVFLGSYSGDPFKWSFDPNLVGTHCIFNKAASAYAQDKPCNCSADWTTGTIPITAALSKAVETKQLKSLNPEDVEPYLQKNLRYKMSYLNDKEVKTDVKSLSITVVSAPVKKAAKNTDLPQWGKFTGNLTVTAG